MVVNMNNGIKKVVNMKKKLSFYIIGHGQTRNF